MITAMIFSPMLVYVNTSLPPGLVCIKRLSFLKAFFFARMKFDTSVISRTVCFKFPVVYEGIKTYDPIISTLTRPHERSTLAHSDALFQSVALANARMFDDRARPKVLDPDRTRMLFGNERGKNGVLPQGFLFVNPIKLKPGHLHGRRRCFTTPGGNQTACRH